MKKQNEIEKELAEKIATEEFNKEHAEHVFSDKYQSRKNNFLSTIEKNKKKKFNWTPKRIIAAAAIALIAIPTTVFAANEIYQWYVTQQQYKLTLSVKGNKENDESKYYKLDLGYLPENIEEFEENKYSYKDNLGQGGFSFVLWKVKKQADFVELNTKDYEEVTYGNNKGFLLNKAGFNINAEGGFSRVVYLMFEKEGYVVETYVGNDVSDKDLEQVFSDLSLKETTEDQASFALDYEEYKKDFEDEPRDDGLADSKLSVDSKNIHKVGDTVTTKSTQDMKFNYTINKVEILDSIKDLDYNNFNDSSIETLQEKDILSEDFSIQTYTQKLIERGNGSTTIDRVIDEKEVTPRFVYLTATIENTSDSDIEDIYFQNSPQLLIKDGGNWVHEDNFNENKDFSAHSLEVDYLDNHGEGKSYYKLPTIQAKEKRVIHFGFFMDEDQIDKMFLPVFNYSNQEDLDNTSAQWIDIRQ